MYQPDCSRRPVAFVDLCATVNYPSSYASILYGMHEDMQ